ncbi:GTP 3',8-cyclase MoaA [Stenoxybacter acetivorans]|uniref:GTP 3',8-cyclase MoaA n=1 Tax=Stenoxybacter acetivorans TaxID=422441 RepID=UPI000565A44E|nr:GTP 3',8-cyclase MoaA [Stenoxybacter acetivorans]
MLTDSFNRPIEYLRLSVTDKCDLRCSYCIPQGFTEFEKPENWLSFDDIERIVAAFARLGTSRFRLTGGEPLLRKNLPDLVSRLAALPGVNDLSLTTNGTQLTRLADPLKRAGLNRLNVSLDSMRRECVSQISGKDSFDKVMAGLNAAKAAGFERIKINMVPLPGVNIDDIDAMIAFCIKQQFILRLIEVMPMGNHAQRLDYFNLIQLIENLKPKYGLQRSSKVYGGGPAKYWENESGSFTLGLITPRSQHFCDTCNRVRLSVDGTLFLCLGQDHSFSLKPYLADRCSDAELENAIQQAINLKPEKHEFNDKPEQIVRIMAKTGG